jgi:hypothetical protein
MFSGGIVAGLITSSCLKTGFASQSGFARAALQNLAQKPVLRLSLTSSTCLTTSGFGQTERGENGVPEFMNYGGHREASFS